MSSVIRSSSIDLNKISFGNIITTKNGRKLIPMTHQGQSLIFQTPKMRAPGGVHPFENKITNEITSLVMNLSFDRANDEHQKFRAVVEGLEMKLLQTASERSKEWFGDEFTISELKKAGLFKSQINVDPTGKYDPALKAKLDYYSGECNAKCSDMNTKEPVDYRYITKGSLVEAIIEIKSVWFIDKKIGLTFKVTRVRAQPNRQEEYDFIEDAPEASGSTDAQDQDYVDY